MSFIFAINDSDFSIMSDMKIGLEDEILGFWSSEKDIKLVKQVGLIKSIIVSPNLVVCFAGNNIVKAAELLREIKCQKYNLEQVVQCAYEIHRASEKDEIEFLIASCDKEWELISIKDYNVQRKCREAWLGSFIAYKEFRNLQQQINVDELKDKTVTPNDESKKIQYVPLDEKRAYIYKLEDIFRKAVKSNCDSSVGGMIVKIKIPEGQNSFEYMEEINCNSGNWPQTIKPNENICFSLGAAMGSFCYHIYQSGNKFCCYIYENKMGIIYTDELCFTESLNGMMFPQIYHLEEEEFIRIAEEKGAFSCC